MRHSTSRLSVAALGIVLAAAAFAPFTDTGWGRPPAGSGTVAVGQAAAEVTPVHTTVSDGDTGWG